MKVTSYYSNYICDRGGSEESRACQSYNQPSLSFQTHCQLISQMYIKTITQTPWIFQSSDITHYSYNSIDVPLGINLDLLSK